MTLATVLGGRGRVEAARRGLYQVSRRPIGRWRISRRLIRIGRISGRWQIRRWHVSGRRITRQHFGRRRVSAGGQSRVAGGTRATALAVTLAGHGADATSELSRVAPAS